MKASLAQEAIKFAEEADDDEDDDEGDDDDDDDDDDDIDMPDTMKAAHFFPFKQFFTQAEPTPTPMYTYKQAAVHGAVHGEVHGEVHSPDPDALRSS